MPLPVTNVAWPPPSTAAANKLYAQWGAWYGGDPEELAAVYQDTPGFGPGSELPTGQPAGARFVTAIARGIQRRFWGSPPGAGSTKQHKLHIPLAGDVAATSADLLFGEPPEFLFPTLGGEEPDDDAGPATNPTKDRLNDILELANAQAIWLEAGEIAAAYGGAYLRVRWDPVVAAHPLLDAIPPDAAVPEWRGQQLVGVTFWRHLERLEGTDSKYWWRHLEYHRAAQVQHALYRSTDEGKLGHRMPLTAHPETTAFALLVDPADGTTIVTGATGMAVEYLPNMRPNRILRGSPLGRSDYQGVEPLMDALDEAWTSWMRDLRLGKGRIIVPKSYLRTAGRGAGATFDLEQEVFTGVDLIDSTEGGMKLEHVQFEIRVEQHDRTCTQLVAQILRGSGYSTQTFGEADEVAATATEVVAREAASYRTRGKKLLYARGPIARLAYAMQEIDIKQFGKDGMVAAMPKVNWPDGVAVDPQQEATTLQLLASARAASVHTLVSRLHPDWDAKKIEQEVIRIREEDAPPPVADPGTGVAGDTAPGKPGEPGPGPADDEARP
jgi:hypothetical protein